MEKSSEGNINPLDAQQVEHGDLIALFVDQFDPPTVNHARAAEAFARCHDVKQVWLAPIGPNGPRRDLTSILCADIASSTRRELVCCTVGLDKNILTPDELLADCRRRFPYLRFIPASIEVRFSEPGYFLSFRGVIPPPKSKVIESQEYLNLDQTKLRADIVSGKDVSRNIPDTVWGYIQKKRLYR